MKRLNKIALSVVAVVAVVSFSGCDEVSKVVDNATQKGKQIAQSASNATKTSNSGGISISVSPSNSVCKNYYAKKIEEIKKDNENVPEKIFRLYATEFKKDGNETICVYFDTIAQGYMNINLTQQEIVEFEKYLLDIGISYDNYKSLQDGFLKRLKLLKYLGLLKSVSSGELYQDKIKYWFNIVGWRKMMFIFDWYENKGEIEVKRFIYDKLDPTEDSTDLRFFYKNERNKYGGGYGFSSTNLAGLRKHADTPDEKAILQWAEQKLKEAR